MLAYAYCVGGTTHSELVQLVNEFADRRRYSAISSCAVHVDTNVTSSAGRVLRHAASARRSSTSVPRKPNSTTSCWWYVIISLHLNHYINVTLGHIGGRQCSSIAVYVASTLWQLELAAVVNILINTKSDFAGIWGLGMSTCKDFSWELESHLLPMTYIHAEA